MIIDGFEIEDDNSVYFIRLLNIENAFIFQRSYNAKHWKEALERPDLNNEPCRIVAKYFIPKDKNLSDDKHYYSTRFIQYLEDKYPSDVTKRGPSCTYYLIDEPLNPKDLFDEFINFRNEQIERIRKEKEAKKELTLF